MLLAGFGAGGPCYYALDVTDPRPTTAAPATTFTSGPTYVVPRRARQH